MAKQTIRIGIELDHIIRNINKQIAKYYQQDYDGSIDLDELDYKDDILRDICEFESDEEQAEFLYIKYPYEVFGCANECEKFLARDLNSWMKELLNQEEYDFELFIYSMKEFDLTIASTYFFLSKIGIRIREVRMPRNYDELSSLADVFITADPKVAKFKDKGTIVIRNNFNQEAQENGNVVYDSFRHFLDEDNKIKIITGCLKAEKQQNTGLCGVWTWTKSVLSSLTKVLKAKLRLS